MLMPLWDETPLWDTAPDPDNPPEPLQLEAVWGMKKSKNIAPECHPCHFCCKNIRKMHDQEFIRGFPGSRGSGVRECGWDPTFHTRRGPG